MKLPHITIEYQEEETYALGKLSGWLISGFAAHWTWIYLFLFNGASLFYQGASYLQNSVFIACIGVQGLTLLCYGLFLEDARKIFSTARKRQRNRTIAALCVFAGMLLAILINYAPSAQGALAAASGALTGFGSAILLMSYGISHSVLDLPTSAVSVAISLPFASGLFALTVLVSSHFPILAQAICLALPFAEFVCLMACSRDLVDNLMFTVMTMPVRTKPFALHVCFPAAAFGILLGIISTRLVPALPFPAQEGATDALPVFLGGLFTGIAIVFAMLTQRKANNFSFRTLMPLVAVLLAALAFIDPDCETGFAPFALFTSYTMIEISFWIFCSDISQHFRISGFTVFGFSWGMLSAGLVAGATLSAQGGLLSFLSFDMTGILAASIVVLVFGVALLPSNSELRRSLKRGSTCPAFDNQDDIAEFGLSEQKPGKIASKAASSTNEAASETETPDNEAADLTDEHKGEENEGGAQGKSLPNSEDAKVANPVPAAFQRGQAQHREESHQTLGRFKRKCQKVADRYLLSRKEAEVLFLLAKGRNSQAIQDSLFISKGTANTHMRHIYRKLDVHSQADLIELVESEQVEDIEF